MMAIFDLFTSQPSRINSKRAKRILWISILCLPIVIYASTIISNSADIPLYDDYEMILSFLNQFESTHGIQDSLSLLFKRENDHIPVFPRLVFLADTLLNSRLNLTHIILVANACLVVMFIVFCRSCTFSEEKKFMFCLPISFFLFQLQYWEITTYAVTAIIFLPTFLFGLLAILFLSTQRPFYLLAACITGTLAAFSAGNGFFVFPIGFIMILLQRRMKDFIIWTIFSLCFIVFYAVLYTSQGSDAFGPSISDLILHPFSLVTYFMAAVGSAGGLGIKIFSIISGIILTLWFLYLTHQRYFNRNPVMYFFIVFLLLTALAIALKRSSYGIDLILLTSRYRLISILLLVSASISFLEIYCYDSKRIHFFRYTLKYSIVLFVLSYILYLPFLNGRYHEVSTGINGLLNNNHALAYNIINVSAQKGIYSPPDGFLRRIDPGYTRNAESKLHNFTTRFNQVGKRGTTFTLRFNIPNGNILDTNMHVLLQKPEVIYLFNSGLTPTTIRETLHNVNPDDFTSDINIKKAIAIGKDGLNVGK